MKSHSTSYAVTWIIGILAVNENTPVFAWMFAILNSIQVCQPIK